MIKAGWVVDQVNETVAKNAFNYAFNDTCRSIIRRETPSKKRGMCSRP